MTSTSQLESLKDNKDVKSQEEAIDESCKRAAIIMNAVKDDGITVFFGPEIIAVVQKIQKSFYAWRPWRDVVTERLRQNSFIDVVVEAGKYCVSPDAHVSLDSVIIVYSILVSMTNCSSEVCKHLAQTDVIPLLVKNISSVDNLHDEKNSKFLSLNMASIHNIAKLPESREKFDAAGAAEAIKLHFTSPSEKLQVSALSSIACLLGDSTASANFVDQNSIIPKLVKCLALAIDGKNYLGFSAEELVESLVFLAVNDDNKERIAASGTLPLLESMLSSSDSLEQSRAIDCLWTLAFKDDIRIAILKMPNCCKRLDAIATSSTDLSLKVKANRAVDYIRIGKKGISSSHSGSSNIVGSPATGGGHIFISYCWKHQEIALKIRNFLVEKGFEVWIDVDDKMHGSTLESMALAVENAALVLICYSEYYKQSNMCRTECEYLFRLGKPFVPINMQYRYFPTGWLGIVLGARLYVDFSLEKHPLEVSVPKLFAEIGSVLGGTNKKEETAPRLQAALPLPSATSDVEDGVCKCCKSTLEIVTDLVASIKNPNNTLTQNIPVEVRTWTTSNVQSWLDGEGFAHLKNTALKDFDGLALIGLYEMKQTAPQLYFSSLMQVVNNSFLDCVRLTAALDKFMNPSQ